MRKLSREEWIEGSFNALVLGGIDSLRVEPLAASLGVTKGSFYHHFENRRALHLALLAEWERLGTSDIIVDVEESESDPVDRLSRLLETVFAPNEMGDAIETSIRAWAATDEVVAEAVARVDDRRVGFVADLLRKAGLPRALATRRAKLVYRNLVGEFIWRSAGGPKSSALELRELLALVLSKPTPSG